MNSPKDIAIAEMKKILDDAKLTFEDIGCLNNILAESISLVTRSDFNSDKERSDALEYILLGSALTSKHLNRNTMSKSLLGGILHLKAVGFSEYIHRCLQFLNGETGKPN